VRATLLLEPALAADRERVRAFAMKFQQLTAPVTAKGVEDTALYRFHRLVSLNEVGGDPDTFGVGVRAFHADAKYRAQHWPHEMLGTSTHDTKRSEDTRVRIDVLSEMPRLWRQMLVRWRRINRLRKREIDGRPAPGPNQEYLLYQILLGSWPLEPMDASACTPTRTHRGVHDQGVARSEEPHQLVRPQQGIRGRADEVRAPAA
jgi:(1->4)-alpha-D-glucan 1-alpha-D-glucosylmutase